MPILKEFKEFAMRGNVLDIAIGIIIGAAFGKIVTSFVNDILMPPIGLLLGGMDFTELLIPLKYAADGAVEVAIRYGLFISITIDFLIVAFAIFLVVKGINRLKRKEGNKEEKKAKPETTKEEKLLMEIRDLLKNKN